MKYFFVPAVYIVLILVAVVTYVYVDHRFNGVYNGNYQTSEPKVHSKVADREAEYLDDTRQTRRPDGEESRRGVIV